MPIKNYTTKIPSDRTVAELSQLLARKGASEIMTSSVKTPSRWPSNGASGPSTDLCRSVCQ